MKQIYKIREIPELLCPKHQEKIEFLDLHSGITKGNRTLCRRCDLNRPTAIEEALKQWQNYCQKQMDQDEKLNSISHSPIDETNLLYQKFHKTFNNLFENIFQVLQDFYYIEKQYGQQNLVSLQDIAQILSEYNILDRPIFTKK